ncbi:MAG: ABC transporter ATP-binding protein [Lacipirellulaceae bacterium]
MIELQRVSLRLGGKDVVADIDWRVERGRHTAVLGPNGSGKTTLLRLACGYQWPSAGRVLRLGEALIDLGTLRRQIGWIASDLAAQIPQDDTAVETVVTGRYAQVGLKRKLWYAPTAADMDEAHALLESLGCGALARRPFGVLSHGERQQVLLARARMAGPLLLVLDEPTSGMDPGVRERFLAWLDERLADPACPTVIYVTHHVEEIVPGLGWTIAVRDGRLHRDGPTAAVVTQELIETLYATRLARLDLVSGRRWPIW